MKLRGKVVVITGASSGIGREMALQLGARGVKVVLAARNEKALIELAGLIERKGGAALAIKTDVSIRTEVERLIAAAISRWGRIDVFINNAGVTHPAVGVAELSEIDTRSVIETNLMGPIYSVWAAVPEMEKTGGGQMVFVSSVVGKRGIPMNGIYCATKFALQGLGESLRLELRGKKIHVLNVYPPGVDTPFYENNGRGSKRTFFLHKVEPVAREIIRAIEKEKKELVMSFGGKLMAAANVFAPGLLEWAIRKNKGM